VPPNSSASSLDYAAVVFAILIKAISYGGGYHYWCALSDGTIIDSPTPAAVAVHNPKLEDMDYVELKGQARHLRKLADDARIRLERLAAAKVFEG
jgi:hypothetical protein